MGSKPYMLYYTYNMVVKSIVTYTDLVLGSQAALKTLSSTKVSVRLVWEYLKELKTLADQSRMKLIWVPGNQWFEGNKNFGELSKRKSEMKF